MSQNHAEVRGVVINIKIPLELANWIDAHVAELRLAVIRSGQRGKHPLPNRNGYIRSLLEKQRAEKEEARRLRKI